MKNIVNKSDIRDVANKIKRESENFARHIDTLEIQLEMLSFNWEGPDATKYITSMKNSTLKKLYKYKESIDNCYEFLNNVVKYYEEFDESVASSYIDI